MFKRLLVLGMSLLSISAQSAVDVSSCPSVYKRNNGNGRANQAAGNFSPFSQNNPVAANVVGTPYQMVGVDPASKTGNWSLYWDSQTPINNLPVISRCWYSRSLSGTSTLLPIVFGPPPPPDVVGNRYIAEYCFYVQNMPNIGVVTFEFINPQTDAPLFYCSYDLSNSASVVKSVDCSPIISAHPANVNLCGTASSASFTFSAKGYNQIQWQESSNGTSWTNLSNGGNYSGVNSRTLQLANANSLSGRYYRARLTANGSTTYCTNTVTHSNPALLQLNPLPNAEFTGAANLCGLGSRNLNIDFAGTGPWTFRYTVNGGSPVTVSSVQNDPHPLAISPSSSSVYTITSVSDRFCTQNMPTGRTSVSVSTNPTITPSDVTSCMGASSVNIPFSISGSANQFSLSAGSRALNGFTSLAGSLSSSPINVSIPSAANEPGVYDFVLVATNSSTGCSSAQAPFTVELKGLPNLSVSGGEAGICSGDSVRLLAFPSNLNAYSWSASPIASVSSVSNPWVKPVQTTTYTLSATDGNGCSSTISKTVSVSASPQLSISAPSSVCTGNTVTLSASGANAYTWSPSSGLSATSGASVLATPSSTTTYTVNATGSNGCSTSSSFTLNVSSASIAVSASANVCNGSLSPLTASGGASYLWYPVTNLFTDASGTTPYTGTSAATVYASPTANTTYFVEGTTASGCKGTSSTSLTVLASPINLSSSTPQNLVFCTHGISTFPLNVATTVAQDSVRWFYSTNGTTYVPVFGVTNPTGVRLTPSTSGSSPNITYRLTLSSFSSSGYSGARFFRLVLYKNGGCTTTYPIFITDTRASSLAPAPTASQTTICSGNSVTLTIGALQSGSTAQWQSSSDSLSWGNISGATSATYSATLTATRFYRVIYNGGTGNCGRRTNVTRVTVTSALPANTVSPSSSCSGGSSPLVLSGSAISSGQYQWQSSTTSSSSGFSDIAGAVTQNYTLPVNVVSSNTWFRRIATNGICNRDTGASVVVLMPISNNSISASISSYCGSSASATSISGSTPTGGTGTPGYQWQQSTDGTNFSNITSSGTSRDYTTVQRSQDYWYRRIVTSGSCSADTGNVIKISLNARPVLTITPASTICEGEEITLSVSGAATYSWSASAINGSNSGSSITLSPSSNGSYTVTATSAQGCTATASTTVTVNELPSSPDLDDDDDDSITVCSGTVDLNSYLESGCNSPQWFSSAVPDITNAISNPGSISAAGTYFVFAYDGGCYSDGYESITVIRNDLSAPVPLNTTASVCLPGTFNLGTLQPALPAGAEFRWSRSASNPSSNLVSNPAAVSTAGVYYLYAYYSEGNCYSSPSQAVTLSLNARPSVSRNTSTVTICSPATVNLGNYINSVSGISYDWYSSAQPLVANRITNPSAVGNQGKYYVFATSSAGCTGSPDSIQLNVNAALTDSISIPQAVCVGSSVSIRAFSNATSFTWQYSINGGSSFANVPAGVPFSGQSSSTLNISNVAGLDGTLWRCVLSNSTCSTNTKAVALVVDTLPTTGNPTNARVSEGSDTSFSVTVSFAPAAEYQWQMSSDNGLTYINVQDNATFDGSNGPTIYLYNVSASFNAYRFRCIAFNSCGSDTSSSALLTVCNSPSFGSVIAATPRCPDDVVPLSVAHNTGAGISLSWYTGPGASGTFLGNSDTIFQPAGTYYARLSGTCGAQERAVNVVPANNPSNQVYLSPTVSALAFDECVQQGWTYYSVTNESQYLFAIRKNGNVFSSRTLITVVDQPKSAPDTAITSLVATDTAVHGSFLMRRYWNVDVFSGNDSFPTPVDIRFYYDPADSITARNKRDSVQAMFSNTTPSPWKWFKTVRTQFDPQQIRGNDFSAFQNIELIPYAYGMENGVHYVQFNGITSFSGGGGGFGFTGGGGALPVTMLSFNAASKSSSIVLDWATQTELNNRGWQIERSVDGDRFETIGWVNGNGTSSQLHQYQFNDENVVPGQMYYYRLKQIDLDGQWSYSRTVSAITGQSELMIGEAYPNPSEGRVSIPVIRKGANDLNVEVKDALGRTVLVQNISKVTDQIEIDGSNLNSGLYFVVIESGSEKHLRKLRIY